MRPAEVLQHISSRLTETAPADLVEEMIPEFPAQAISWARCLTYWDEFRGAYPARAIAVARIISRRAMREHGLTITEDGRVIGRDTPASHGSEPDAAFTIKVAGRSVEVSHRYALRTGSDSFSFEADDNPLSSTGFWHIFVPHDVVEALGGAEAFAAQIAEEKVAGTEKEFMARFEGEHPWRKAVGKHTEAVTKNAAGASVQGGLFDE